MVLVEIEHVHLVFLATIPVQFLLVCRLILHLLLLVLLQFTHHLERVCRLSLLFFDHNEVNVRPRVRLIVLHEITSCLVHCILLNYDIYIKDAVRLQVVDLTRYNRPVGNWQTRHWVPV